MKAATKIAVHPALLEAQSEWNREVVAGQQKANGELLGALTRRDRRETKATEIRALTLEWIFRSWEEMVVDLPGGKAFTLHELYEAGRYLDLACAIGVIQEGPIYPRPLCRCHDAACLSCDGEEHLLQVPIRIRELRSADHEDARPCNGEDD